jgi:integrase
MAWMIQARVHLLGEAIGLKHLSPHDLRHYWASAAIAGGTDLLALQEAGGWASLDMPRRYVERAKIANERVKLQVSSCGLRVWRVLCKLYLIRSCATAFQG